MKNNLLYSIAAGLFSIGNNAAAKTAAPRPYFVGPDLYQIHTDAHLFGTRVFVNGKQLKLSNADGNGSIRNQNYSVSGATGYPNKNYLNAYLKPGDNEIKVIFDAPLLEQVKGTEGEVAFIRDMYAHVVINTGELTDGSLGTKSYDLDEAIQAADNSTTILKDALLKRFTSEQLTEEVSVIYNITIDAKYAVQIGSEACDIEADGFSNLKGKLLLNGKIFLDITDYGSGTMLENIKELIVPGENHFEVDITSLEENKPSSAILKMDCDMGSIKDKVGLPVEYQSNSFGSFFNHIYIPIASIGFDKPGKYSTKFYYSE